MAMHVTDFDIEPFHNTVEPLNKGAVTKKLDRCHGNMGTPRKWGPHIFRQNGDPLVKMERACAHGSLVQLAE